MQWHDVRGRAAKEAQEYASRRPYRKSKNILVALMLGLPVIALAILIYMGVEIGSEALVPTLIAFILAGFVFQNQRWAMIAYACMFIANWFASIVMGSPISAFGIMVAVLVLVTTNVSVRVATALQKNGDNTTHP